MQLDLSHVALEIREGRQSATNLMQMSIAAARSPLCANVFSQTFFDEARWAAAETPSTTPLAGLAISVKDLFDIKGLPTAAGSSVLAGAAPEWLPTAQKRSGWRRARVSAIAPPAALVAAIAVARRQDKREARGESRDGPSVPGSVPHRP